jgi:hypothetical protein
MEKFELIRDWASKRGIYDMGDVKTQFAKLIEETGELAKAILKKDEPEFIDAIGDIAVVLTNLAFLGNKYFDENRSETYYEDVAGDGGSMMEMTNEDWISIETCIESAYDVIKSRTGKMENGTFKKDEKITRKQVKGDLHKNGYYNLPCVFTDINSFLKNHDIILGDKVFTDKDDLHLIAKPSLKQGGKAYVRVKDIK